MEQQQAQTLFSTMIRGHLWRFNPELATIPYQEYLNILNSITPQNYEIAYNLGPLNYIEKGTLEENGQPLNAIVRERTWHVQDIQAFELQVTTIPKLIILDNRRQEEPQTITTTFWVDRKGEVVAYRQIYNSNTVCDENYVKEKK